MDDETNDDERIRALLADAGATGRGERVPDEVATRLDRTLGELVAEREDAAQGSGSGPGSDSGTVVPLRRRWAPRLAAAAAAVIVIGAGGVAAINLGTFGGSEQADSTSAGSAEAKRDTGALAEVPALSSASFDRDVAALLADEPAPLRPDAREGAGDSAALPCPGPAGRTEADRRTVQLDGAPAALLVHPERAGRQLVEAWTCDGEDRLVATRVRR